MENVLDMFTTEIKICGICGEAHSPNKCNVIPIKNLITNKLVPPRAKLSIPNILFLKTFADASITVCTKERLEKGTQFGPYEAKKRLTLLPSIEFPLKIFSDTGDDFEEYYLDSTDQFESNWMIFVKAATNIEEQNLISYQQDDQLYYATIRDIDEGEELKVWYAPYYARKMNKALLVPSNSENVLKNRVYDDHLVKQKRNVTSRDTWNCKFCGQIENNLVEFAKHLVYHYRAKSKRMCEICEDTFLTRQMYQKHMKMAHKSEIPKNTEPDQEVISPKNKIVPKDSNIGGPLLLNVASDSLDNSSLLILPQDILNEDLLETENLNVDCIINENVKELDHFNFELSEPDIEQLICDICLKSFSKLKYLIMHLDQHTGKHTCYQCNKVFARKENLTFHSCNSYYRIKCRHCDKLFFQKKAFNQHNKIYHEKAFTCQLCLKVLPNKKTFKEHRCNEEPVKMRAIYNCNVCNKQFRWRRNMITHMKKHNEDNMSLICPTCGAILSSRSSYLRHLKLHEGHVYKCDICEKVFKRNDNLLDHKTSVHQNKEETCDLCSKKFKSKKYLRIHIKTHETEKNFKCNHCEAAFKQNMCLQRHLKTHKNKKSADQLKPGESLYSCPECNKKMKHGFSIRRHLKTYHPLYAYDKKKIKLFKNDNEAEKENQDEDSVIDLKQTIENMNFNTDEVNNDNIVEIDDILKNENIFSQNDSCERIINNLIDKAVERDNINHDQQLVCLSMPDLSEGEQDIQLGENAYILEDGTIVETKKDSPELVLYIIDKKCD